MAVTAAVILALAIGGVVWVNGGLGGEEPGGQPPTLANGESFAFVTSSAAGSVLVDQADFLTGSEAKQAAVEDGVIGPEDDLPNDFYIRNQETTSLSATVADDARLVVWTTGPDGSLVETVIDFDGFFALFAGTPGNVYGFDPDAFPVEITVEDGIITEVKQVYLP